MQNPRGRWGPGTCRRKRSPSRENGPRGPQLLAFQQRGPTMSCDSTEWKGHQYVPGGRTLARVAFAGAPPLRPRLLCCVEQADTRGVSSERCLHRAADRSRRRAPRPRPTPPNTQHRDAFMLKSRHPTRLGASVACGLGEARALRPCS